MAGSFVARSAAAVLLACLGADAVAAPFTPSSDNQVVERLPGGASDPSVRRVDSLRKQLAARPDDLALRVEIARRYFDLAMAQGDPRFVGYAAAAINPLAKAAVNDPGYWLVRGLLQQYSHDFNGALASLNQASALDPRWPEPIAWRAAIHMVQARYGQALAECEKLEPAGQALLAQGCLAYARSSAGQLPAAYDSLGQLLAHWRSQMGPELALWQLTRLAEMAIRLERFDQAEVHFKQALGLGLADQFLLGAYADFLLLRGRPREVIELLAQWERSDILLLRLALAARALNDPRAVGWASQLRDRFRAAAQRGDRLHEQEAARFELDLQGQPAKALKLAQANYQTQKEPRDAQILMRAALAAGQARAAQPALDWLRTSRYQDPALANLAGLLAAPGASR